MMPLVAEARPYQQSPLDQMACSRPVTKYPLLVCSLILIHKLSTCLWLFLRGIIHPILYAQGNPPTPLALPTPSKNLAAQIEISIRSKF